MNLNFQKQMKMYGDDPNSDNNNIEANSDKNNTAKKEDDFDIDKQ